MSGSISPSLNMVGGVGGSSLRFDGTEGSWNESPTGVPSARSNVTTCPKSVTPATSPSAVKNAVSRLFGCNGLAAKGESAGAAGSSATHLSSPSGRWAQSWSQSEM
jgi:hypothetical protein